VDSRVAEGDAARLVVAGGVEGQLANQGAVVSEQPDGPRRQVRPFTIGRAIQPATAASAGPDALPERASPTRAAAARP
jgi:hypothetical protein